MVDNYFLEAAAVPSVGMNRRLRYTTYTNLRHEVGFIEAWPAIQGMKYLIVSDPDYQRVLSSAICAQDSVLYP